MKLKHIVAAAALVATSSSFADILMNTGTATSDGGLYLGISSLDGTTSYDFDLQSTFNTIYAHINDTSFTQSWTVSDANWTTFLSSPANDVSLLHWSVNAGLQKGPISTVGNKAFLTTLSNEVTVDTITTGTGGSVGQIAAAMDYLVGDFNGKAGGELSFIATKGVDESYFGATAEGMTGRTLNGKLTPGFDSSNLVGDSASFYYVTSEKSGKLVGGAIPSIFTGKFTFNVDAATHVGTLTYATPVPSVPEPSGYVLALTGLMVAGVLVRRRSN